MDLGQNSLSSSITKAVVYDQIVALDQWLAGQRTVNFNQYYRNEIQKYFENSSDFKPTSSNRLPDGSPIGMFSCDH